ncbi:MAG: hypothetical protein GX846_01785, partial [Deltaproteobacteria bacterium]|nr:hypothetical protein [Deltaproteobacteria bacterium]
TIKGKFKKISDNMVEVAYSVKLRNNTDKAMTKDITVAFMDKNSRSVGSRTKTTSSFNAGESKVITDTITLTATDANRIATGNVTINDLLLAAYIIRRYIKKGMGIILMPFCCFCRSIQYLMEL